MPWKHPNSPSTEPISVSEISYYYDRTSESYDARYYRFVALTDDQHLRLLNSLVFDGKALEVGVGSGRLLSRLEGARLAIGLDVSHQMLLITHRRGQPCIRANTAAPLPFPDETFDLVYSFKVLSHVPYIESVLRELVRVTKPGGHLVLEFYNRHSLKYLLSQKLKDFLRLKPIYTRYDSVDEIRNYVPENVSVYAIGGYGVLQPLFLLWEIPGIGWLMYQVENVLKRTCLQRWGGFIVLHMCKEPPDKGAHNAHQD